MEPPRDAAPHGRHRGPRDLQEAFAEFDQRDAELDARIIQVYGDDDIITTNDPDLYTAASTAWKVTPQ